MSTPERYADVIYKIQIAACGQKRKNVLLFGRQALDFFSLLVLLDFLLPILRPARACRMDSHASIYIF